MDEDLVNVYSVPTLPEAQLLSDRLRENGIDNFIDNVANPMDGLVAMDITKIIRVLPRDVERAREIIKDFEEEPFAIDEDAFAHEAETATEEDDEGT